MISALTDTIAFESFNVTWAA